MRVGAAISLAGLLWAVAGPALADEPRGCDKFKWPVAREQAALVAADLPRLASGAQRSAGPDAFAVALTAPAAARLPMPPERAAKQGPDQSGFINFAAPAEAGTYEVVLSAGVWVDVVQGGAYLKPLAFSGALDCAGVRKLLRFEIAPSPFILQISGATADSLKLIVEPVSDAAK